MIKNIFLLFFLISCSHFASGVYVILKEKDTLTSLAREFKTRENYIKDFNSHARFIAGEMIFIPFDAGILGQVKKSDSYLELFSKDYIWPVPKHHRISSKYGGRWGGRHNGIDIPAKTGTDVMAAANGVVVYSGNEFSGFGNVVIVAHNYGFFTLYAHNSKNIAKAGDQILKGERIALVGNTGRSTGPHLHFEVRKYNTPLDPLTLFPTKH